MQLVSLSQHFYSESVLHISQIAFCYVNEDAGQQIEWERLVVRDPAMPEMFIVCILSPKFPVFACTCCQCERWPALWHSLVTLRRKKHSPHASSINPHHTLPSNSANYYLFSKSQGMFKYFE